MPWRERWAISFYGIHGIGTFYYLSHGLEEAEFALQEQLWAVAALVVLISVVVHGLSGAVVLERLDMRRESQRRAAARVPPPGERPEY